MKNFFIKYFFKSNWRHFFKNKQKRVGFKLFISVAAVIFLFIVISTYYSIKQTGRILLEAINEHGSSVSMLIANSSVEKLFSWDYPALQAEVDSVGEADSQILKIVVTHESKVVANYTSEKYQGSEEAIEKRSPVETVVAGKSEYLGEVSVFMSKDKYYEFSQSEIKRSLIYGLFLLIGDTVISYITIAVILLAPIKRITEGAEIIGRGNLNHRIEITNKDEIGDLAETINIMTSNLKRSREILDEAKNKTSAIIANLGDPIIMVKNKKVILFNSAAEDVFKLTKEDLGAELNHSGDASCLGSKFCLCDFRGLIKEIYISKVLEYDEDDFPIVEDMTLNKNGYKEAGDLEDDHNNIIFKVLTSPVVDKDGRYYGHMKVFYNLTRERRIDNLKSKFITVAAHQLRTPLSGIKWSLNMILNEEMGEINMEVRKYLKETSNANERMIKLVDDFLNIAHIEEGHLLEKKEDVSLEKLVIEIVEILKFKSQKNNNHVDLVVSELGIPNVKVDKKKIKLAIQNIVDNAIKYSNPGKNVTIKLEPTEEDDIEYIEIKIEDSGIGISSSDRKKIFSKFFRADNAVKAIPEGSGFGLFIAKNIILAHHGKIWFESEPEKGTTFFIHLPINDLIEEKE